MSSANKLPNLCEFNTVDDVFAALGFDPRSCGERNPNTSLCFFFDTEDKVWLNANLAKHISPSEEHTARYRHFLNHHRHELRPDVIEQLEVEIVALSIRSLCTNP